MPRFIIIATHAPSQCPGVNKQMGEIMQKVTEEAMRIGEKRGVKLLEPPIHLSPSHKIMAILEAPNADALNDHLFESRLMQVQDIEMYWAEPMPELMKKAEALGQKPLY
jgi:hypothetical protein